MSWEVVAARVLPGWAWRFFQVVRMRPYPRPRIIEIEATGGGGKYVDFAAHVVNHGTQQYRYDIVARVGEVDIECAPAKLDLIPSEPPRIVRVLVPRPELGDLVKQFNDATTLYDQTLHVEIRADGKRKDSIDWHEEVYTAETNRERYEIQQRVWRFARGEETEADRRAEHLAERIRRHDEESDGPEFYDV